MNKVSFNQPVSVRLKNDTPIKVEWVEAEKNKNAGKAWKLVWFFLGLTAFIFTVFGMVWQNSREKEHYAATRDDVHYSICYPTYLAASDRGAIEITLLNKSTKPLQKVKASLAYWPEQVPIIINSNNGSTITDFGTLETGEARTRKIDFQLNSAADSADIFFLLEITSPNAAPINRECKIIVFGDSIRLFLKHLTAIFFILMNLLVTLGAPEIGKFLIGMFKRKSTQ